MKRLLLTFTTSLALLASTGSVAYAGKASPSTDTPSSCSIVASAGGTNSPTITFAQTWSGLRTSSINFVSFYIYESTTRVLQYNVVQGTSSTTNGWYGTSRTSGKVNIDSQSLSALSNLSTGTSYKLYITISYGARNAITGTHCDATAS